MDGSGIYRPSTAQFVYYQLWAYSYKYGAWTHSAMKRVLDGYPNGVVQVYDASRGLWAYADVGGDSFDLAVGPNTVSLMPAAGSGAWFVEVETYWAPPFVNMTTNDLTNPNAAPGGLNTYDSAGTCTF